MSYADVNGVSLYYEEHGSGRPLILLHGGLGAAGMYAPILPTLAQDRRVIAVDLQARRTGTRRTWTVRGWWSSLCPAGETAGTRRAWPGWTRWERTSPSR